MTVSETAPKGLDALIVRTPGVCGGWPHIRNHRIGVHRIAGWWKLGLSMEEMLDKLPTLDPAEIHAALAYYHLNRPEIEAFLEEERSTMGAAEKEFTAA
jgi:uncharacterized protein (DUF433 family)